MRTAGEKTLALWRESGEWWAGEPYSEFRHFVDAKGSRRESSRKMPCLGEVTGSQAKPYIENNREEISLRVRKVRDEKVAKATGFAPVFHWQQGDRLQSVGESYAMLHTLSGYSFGRSVMLAEEIPAIAARRGVCSVLLADWHSLTGAVEFVQIAEKLGVKPLIGATLELEDGGEIVLVAKSKRGYQNLSQLITANHLDEPRLFPLCRWRNLERYSTDLMCLTGGENGPLNRLTACGRYQQALEAVQRLTGLFGKENTYLQIERSYHPWQIKANHLLEELADTTGITAVAGYPCHLADRAHLPALDALICSDTLCTIDEVVGRKPQRHETQPEHRSSPRRPLNAERFLRCPSEMAALYADKPELIRSTLLLADKCDNDVLPGRTRLPQLFPDEPRVLREATYAGARERHSSLRKGLVRRLEHELERIIRLGYSGHFLVAWDFCDWARENDIVLSGRGSVVDSAVAYCLGLSRIDAYHHGLHFDRFLPADGSKRPDIDVDFEAARRDDVRNYMAAKYGQERVATVAAIGAYCSRGIIREVGKVMGLPEETVSYLSKRLHGGVTPERLESALDARPELRDSNIPREKFRWVFRLAERLMDVPRNMRAHSSGVILSANPIAETVPVQHSGVEEVKIIQWDKRSARRCFDKFDILCLRGNDVLSGTERRVRQSNLDFDVEKLPLDDPDTYRAMRSGELIGIPQSASPAMRQAHVRLRTENLSDASLVQAGIRPGVGGAVKINELIARRRGKPYSFSDPKLEEILGPTYGIIVFQEQVDQLLQAFAGFSSGEAEETRDSIHKRRREGYAESVRDEIVRLIVEQGYAPWVAEEVTGLVAGFQGYGFAQGHALAFAEISVRSVHCQQNYPAEFHAALLNAQPAGYYGPCTIANEARNRGVAILKPDVNASFLDFSVEDLVAPDPPCLNIPNGAIRVSLKQIGTLSRQTAERIVRSRLLPPLEEFVPDWKQHQRVDAPFSSLFDFVSRVLPERDELEALILCGALDGMHPNRREMLWSVPSALRYAKSCAYDPHSLDMRMPEPELTTGINDFSYQEKALAERQILGLDIDRHLMAFERERVSARGAISCGQANHLRPGTRAYVVGNPQRLRFPPTQSGKRVVFFDLEDETGLANVTCFDRVYQRDGHTLVCAPYVTVLGEAQDRDGHTAFLAHRVFPYQPAITRHLAASDSLPIVTGDFLVG